MDECKPLLAGRRFRQALLAAAEVGSGRGGGRGGGGDGDGGGGGGGGAGSTRALTGWGEALALRGRMVREAGGGSAAGAEAGAYNRPRFRSTDTTHRPIVSHKTCLR